MPYVWNCCNSTYSRYEDGLYVLASPDADVRCFGACFSCHEIGCEGYGRRVWIGVLDCRAGQTGNAKRESSKCDSGAIVALKMSMLLLSDAVRSVWEQVLIYSQS